MLTLPHKVETHGVDYCFRRITTEDYLLCGTSKQNAYNSVPCPFFDHDAHQTVRKCYPMAAPLGVALDGPPTATTAQTVIFDFKSKKLFSTFTYINVSSL